ncbi:hypothetical protein EJB05_17089, partial [Eragrostis curvula]
MNGCQPQDTSLKYRFRTRFLPEKLHNATLLAYTTLAIPITTESTSLLQHSDRRWSMVL